MFQQPVTGECNITPNEKLYDLNWTLTKEQVMGIGCDSVCHISLTVKTRSDDPDPISITCACKYLSMFKYIQVSAYLNTKLSW